MFYPCTNAEWLQSLRQFHPPLASTLPIPSKETSLTVLVASSVMVCVGSMCVASPLWTPAFSTCSHIAWQITCDKKHHCEHRSSRHGCRLHGRSPATQNLSIVNISLRYMFADCMARSTATQNITIANIKSSLRACRLHGRLSAMQNVSIVNTSVLRMFLHCMADHL